MTRVRARGGFRSRTNGYHADTRPFLGAELGCRRWRLLHGVVGVTWAMRRACLWVQVSHPFFFSWTMLRLRAHRLSVVFRSVSVYIVALHLFPIFYISVTSSRSNHAQLRSLYILYITLFQFVLRAMRGARRATQHLMVALLPPLCSYLSSTFVCTISRIHSSARVLSHSYTRILIA